MFRQVRRTVVRRRAVQKFLEPPRRWSQSSSSPSAGRRSAVVAGLFAISGSAALWWSQSPRRVQVAEAPRIPDVASEGDIAVRSPVEVLGLEAADGKLREQAQSFTFRSGPGRTGRVDVVRLASNCPVEDEWALAVGKGLGGGTTLFAGVYDGHAGWATSRVLKDSLISYVSHAVARLSPASDDGDVDRAIKDAFVRLDARIMDAAREAANEVKEDGAAQVLSALAPAMAGSCALLAIYDGASSTLRTAVTGDSRAVLGVWSPKTRAFSAKALSKDQTGFNEDEVRRLEAEHPGETRDIVDAASGRLLGMAMTRAFGDHRWKWPGEVITSAQARFFGQPSRGSAYTTPPYMTARPEVTTRQVDADDFVILASDGLWDVMSSQDAVACVERWLAAKRAGQPEATAAAAPWTLTVGEDGYPSWRATPEHFVTEDLDSAAVCLVKNALGGRRRGLFCGVMTADAPSSRYVRDDITVQVVFFRDPYMAPERMK